MRQAKIGAIFLMAIILLAGIGTGIAAWRDKIMIDGRVRTGSLDLEVIEYSGTWVWKRMSDDACIILHRPDVAPGPGSILVASSWAEQYETIDGEPIDDRVMFHYQNIFPCIDFTADVKFHYNGSIPGKIHFLPYRYWSDVVTLPWNGEEVQWLGWLMNNVDGSFERTMYIERTNPDGQTFRVEFHEGFQLHYCDIIYFEFTIHIPQEIWIDHDGDGEVDDGEEYPTDFLQNVGAGGYFDFEVIQWNEYDEIVGP